MSSTSSSPSTTKKKKEIPAAADNHEKNPAASSEKIPCGKEETGGGRGGGGDCYYWENLPATAIHRVCLMAGNASALHFCATCKAYRAAQPPLRVLSIRQCLDYELDDRQYLSQESLQNEFCIRLVEPKNGAHRVVEALSSRHAQEITHLFMVAIHDYDRQTDGPKPLLKGNLESYGVNLTSLQTLVIVQPRVGHTGDDEQFPHPHLKDCALHLVLATMDSLKALKISAPWRFDLLLYASVLMQAAGRSLHYLDLDIELWVGERTRGQETNTVSLRRMASEHCTSLLAPARIICREHHLPWQPLYLEQPPPNWPDDERQAFFELHQQCLTPRCSEEDETSTSPPQSRCREGYSGVWCGNLGYCSGAPSEPLDPAYFASPLG